MARADRSCCGGSWISGTEFPATIRSANVFRALDPKGLEAVLRKFSKSFGVKGVVSIDGKALRGAFTRGRQATPLHMVNVWAAGTRMALAQRKAPNRNEIAGALEVLALLDLDGAIVTADALHCRPDTAQAIRDRKGHYVLAIKSNRGRLFKAAKTLLDTARKPHGQASEGPPLTAASNAGGPSSPCATIGEAIRLPRYCRRRPHRQLACHRRQGRQAKVRYFLASRLLSAKKLLEVVRAHWGIENNLHWVLDVLFDEDACRSRKDHAAENLALIRKLALNALQATPGPARISHKMLHARWDNDFLLSALAHMR